MSEEIEAIRAKASTIAARIKAEPAFKAQLEQDPENTLLGAGLPANAIPDFLAEVQSELVGVQGYMECSITCAVTSSTCTVTGLL
jgi:hypothetical protein